MLLSSEAEWVRDGHFVWLELSHATLNIVGVQCPNEKNPTAPCRHVRHGCLVRHFLQLYGLECNVGVCEPAGYLEIAWCLQGDSLDPDLAQVWVIPTTDTIFSAFLTE